MLSRLDGEPVFSFGPFRLYVKQRLLLEGERPVRLGSRAFDVLIALVEGAGTLITKDELMARIWPNAVVEPANLTVHVAALRRALSDGRGGNHFLVNVHGRGYRFVAPVSYVETPMAATHSLTNQHNLPVCLTPLIGRSDVINSLSAQLSFYRLITVVGQAGIGKTSVALAAAELIIPNYRDGIWLIDLSPVAAPRLVLTALASALKLAIRTDNPLPSLIAALRDRQLLLVLDNCEHVIGAAADLVSGLLRGTSGIQILATSREPLRVEGERLRRLSALGSPPFSAELNATDALKFPAVQLFVERAAATMNKFVLTDSDAASAGRICRELDGIPLAIELAAARIDLFGVAGLATCLDDRLRLLTGGRRTSFPRHKTMNEALDWSYQLLSKEEQTVFRCIAIFAAGFTLEAAVAVAARADTTESDVADQVANLAMKSLIAVEMGHGKARFRLPETTRAFALSLLAESGERDKICCRHAAYYRDLLNVAWSTPGGGNTAAAWTPEIDNIRAGLNWAFGPEGDPSIAVDLAAVSAPLLLDMSLLTECHGWMGKALDLLHATDQDARREMVLQTAFGLSLMFTRGMSRRAHVALTRATELAERLGDLDYQLRALAGLNIFSHRLEDFQGALAISRRSEGIARGVTDRVAISAVDCHLSCSLFFLAQNAEALAYAQQAYQHNTTEIRRAHIVRSGMDHSIQAHCVAAHIEWLCGLVDQSTQTIQKILTDAEAGAHPVSLCFALTWCGCVLSLRLGDFETAERAIVRLKDHAKNHALHSYYACGLGFEGVLSVKRGDPAVGERLLGGCLDGLRSAQYEVLHTAFLGDLAEVLAIRGHFDAGLAAIDEALERTERNNGLWWMPEALRIKGEILLLSDQANARSAEDHFRRSLDLARHHGALSWGLRGALSLGRLHRSQGRIGDARDMLDSVYSRFTEGFYSADLQTAKLLLKEWTNG
jgi:predicted ATPase/DNA-binding winged helix-turn-helix (wHTH) protein